MSQFPTNKTVPLDKDIGVHEALPAPANTGAREQLSEVLKTLNQAVATETANRIAADNAEATTRANADSALQTALNQEISDRIADVNVEESARILADGNEATARSNADTDLQNQINAERALLRMTASNKTVAIAGAIGTRLNDNTKLGLPNGSLVSDFEGATVNFQNGTITYGNQSGPIVQQTTVDADILTSWNSGSGNLAHRYGFWFTAASNAGTGSVVFRLSGSGSLSVDARAYIYSDNAGIPGTLIGSSAVGSINLTTTKTDYTFTFTSPVSLTAGQKYYVLVGINHTNAFLTTYIWGDQGTPGDSGPNSSYVFTTDSGASWNVGGSVGNGIDPYFILNSTNIGGPSAGSFTPISFSGQAGKWAKYALILLPTIPNTILVLNGDSYATSAAGAAAPAFDGGIPIGIVAVKDNGSGGSGTIDNVLQTSLTQFLSAGAGAGGSGSGSPLDVEESSFTYYTRSDFAVDKKKFLGSTTGIDQILGLKKVVLNVGQVFTSSDLIGAQVRSDAPSINSAQAKLLYTAGKVDEAAIVQLSRDGGNSWQNAVVSLPGSSSASEYEGTMVIADINWATSTSALFNGGAPNGTLSSGQRVAAIINPSYRVSLSSFEIFLRTTATAGSLVGRIMSVTSGTPNSVLRSSAETLQAGQDTSTTGKYQRFSFKPITLEPGTQYALVIEGTGLNANISADQVTSGPAFSISSSTHNGSGWSASAAKLAMLVYGTGLDLRLRVTSGTAGSELLGFGVDFVQDSAALVTGNASYEERYITATEASTGLITLNTVYYTPGSRQLQVHIDGHVFMAPDFNEIGPKQVQFAPNFFVTGDLVKFRNSYGLVDGTSYALSKIAAMYDAIVGTSAQVAAGVATHSTLAAAIASVPAGGKILLLKGTLTENVIINQNVAIEGQGYGTVVNGTFTMNAGANYSTIKNLKFGGNITLNATGCYIQECFKAVAATLTEAASAINAKQIIEE
jgi:hypothetical protein